MKLTVKTLFNEPKTASQAAFVTRIIARAERLVESGYTIKSFGNRAFYVILPGQAEAYPFDEGGYHVNNTPGEERCSCQCFEDVKDCKHRIAVALMEAEEAAQVLRVE